MSSEFMGPILRAGRALRAVAQMRSPSTSGRCTAQDGAHGRTARIGPNGDNPPMQLPSTFDPTRATAFARETLQIEAGAITAMAQRLDGSFAQALSLMLACQGRVVVMGIGKSGHIGRKIAATLASTGTPAMFVHPAERSE